MLVRVGVQGQHQSDACQCNKEAEKLETNSKHLLKPQTLNGNGLKRIKSYIRIQKDKNIHGQEASEETGARGYKVGRRLATQPEKKTPQDPRIATRAQDTESPSVGAIVHGLRSLDPLLLAHASLLEHSLALLVLLRGLKGLLVLPTEVVIATVAVNV